MPDQDDLLQKKLSALENGQPLEAVLRQLPDEDQELASLIRLASALRSMPHPSPASSQVQAQRQSVLTAAKTLPRRDTQPTLPAGRPFWRAPFAGAAYLRNLRPAAALSMAGALMAMIILAVIGAGFWNSSRMMDTARVENIVGQVQVAADVEGREWKNLSAGERVQRGQRVRALGASSADLVFFEGTRAHLAPQSDVSVTELDGSSGQRIQVELAQNSGETRHQVTSLKGEDSFYLVRTSSGVASVHGTSFNVKVNEDGQSTFAVDTGEVRVSSDLSEVTLLPGQATAASPTGEIAPPNYQFTVTGSVTAIDTGSWAVSGLTFAVTADSSISAAFDLGDTVRVTGRILEDGTLLADWIDAAADSGQTASFTGTLEAMDGETWQVSGTPVQITGETALDAALAVGDPVRVTFNLLEDGSWLALAIERLAEDDPAATATPTATADPNAMPSYEFTPDELGAADCGTASSQYSLTGTLRNTSNDAKDYAANVTLGYLIERGGEYVSTVELVPGGWSRIDAGQAVNFIVNVSMTSAWAGAPEDAEVKIRVFVASATNRPDHLQGRVTVTIAKVCQVTPTPQITGTVTETPTPETSGTPTLLPTAQVTPTTLPNQADQCTGAEPHPTGLTLAQRYGVPYEEIMFWFCQHYGFGEIDLAYSLAHQAGIPVEEVFAMRASGMGWGSIKKTLLEGEKGNDNDKGKGSDAGSNNSNGDGDDQGKGSDKNNGKGKGRN